MDVQAKPEGTAKFMYDALRDLFLSPPDSSAEKFLLTPIKSYKNLPMTPYSVS